MQNCRSHSRLFRLTMSHPFRHQIKSLNERINECTEWKQTKTAKPTECGHVQAFGACAHSINIIAIEIQVKLFRFRSFFRFIFVRSLSQVRRFDRQMLIAFGWNITKRSRQNEWTEELSRRHAIQFSTPTITTVTAIGPNGLVKRRTVLSWLVWGCGIRTEKILALGLSDPQIWINSDRFGQIRADSNTLNKILFESTWIPSNPNSPQVPLPVRFESPPITRPNHSRWLQEAAWMHTTLMIASI